MSQSVGQFKTIELSRSRLRPRELAVPVAVSPTYFPNQGSTYNSQSVQLLDRFGNAAGLIRAIPPKTAIRVITAAWPSATGIQRIQLPYNIGGGVMRFTMTDDTTPPGILKVYDSRDLTHYIAIGPGSTMDIPAGQNEIALDVTVAGAKVIATICYTMEIYQCAITFNSQPVAGDHITANNYVRFEFIEAGGAVTEVGNLPVEISEVDLATTIANFITAFNTAYVAAIEPAASMTPFMWARAADTNDLVYFKPLTAWKQIADPSIGVSGVMVYSVDQGLINGLVANTTNYQTLNNL